MKPDPTKLDDLIRDMKRESPKPDWNAIDAKLFARIEQEPRPLSSEVGEAEPQREQGRVVWIGASLTLAAAAAALLLVHPSISTDSRAERPTPAGTVMFGDVSVQGDRIAAESLAYFETPNASADGWAVRWVVQGGSVLNVEHTASPLVVSLEKGAAEAQVTPVLSGEAFAIDVKASSGALVRVAVHGTHLRVARDGDKVIIDLTEGVVSIGAPPRRGSTIGTLVTAPAHVELDARDLGTMHVDHTLGAVRAPEAVTPTPRPDVETAFVAPINNRGTSHLETSPEVVVRPQTQSQSLQKPLTTPSTTAPVIETWLRSSDEVAGAIHACIQNAVMSNATFSTTLTMKTREDGFAEEGARFSPPLPPETRDCAANVIYKRTKMLGNDDVAVLIEVKR